MINSTAVFVFVFFFTIIQLIITYYLMLSVRHSKRTDRSLFRTKKVLHNIPRPEDREFLSSPPQILSVSRAIAASKDLDGDPKDKSEVSRLQRASADREVTSHSPWTCSFRQDRLDDSANRCVSRGRFKSSFIASDLVVFEMLGLGVDWARIERAARVEGERRPFEHGDCNGR